MDDRTPFLEWPPHSGIVQGFPEIDRVEWFDLDDARRRLKAAQVPFLDRLQAALGSGFARVASHRLRPSTVRGQVPPESDLRLYDYVASANCYKVRLLLAQLERPYKRIPIDIFNGDTLTDEYARINAFRSTPVLEVAPDRYLIESNAILVYLADGTPLLPTGTVERCELVRWLIYEQTDVMPATGGLRFRLQTGRLTPDHPDAARRKTAGEDVLRILNDHLSGRDFLVADKYSIADIAVYAYAHVAHEAGYELERWPAVQAWLRRVAERPRYVNDLLPYPSNAHAGVGRSIYD